MGRNEALYKLSDGSIVKPHPTDPDKCVQLEPTHRVFTWANFPVVIKHRMANSTAEKLRAHNG